jgi:hypothetical protein
MDRIGNAATAVISDFPVFGTLIMVFIFVYAWLADTVERKESFEDYKEKTPPVVIENFYVNNGTGHLVDRAYALDT